MLSKVEFAIIGIARPLCGDPNSAGNLIKENITELPSYENTSNW